MPYGLVELRRRQLHDDTGELPLHKGRSKALAAVQTLESQVSLRGDDYEAVLGYLRSRGIDDYYIRLSSMPEASLAFIREHVQDTFAAQAASEPLFGLHVGNFIGVSLAHMTTVLMELNPQSRMVSIDPNLTHLAVESPQNHALAILSKCGLQKNSLVVAGYSGAKSISSDGMTAGHYDPVKEYLNEAACENTIQSLGALSGSKFHFAMLDGNHEADYLRQELDQIKPLLRDDAIVVLDDVSEHWKEISKVYENAAGMGFQPVAADGRVGILRLQPAPAPAA